MLIDTHCHLDFSQFDPDREEVIGRAKKAGVGLLINIGSSLEGSRRSVELAEKYDFIYATVGVHPHYAEAAIKDSAADILADLAQNKKVVGIGEVGLDYYRNLSPQDAQKEAFRSFIGLSKNAKLPLIIHSRQAHKDTLDILKQECGGSIKGVMHCFSGDESHLKECLDLGLYISFTANITFDRAKGLKELVKKVPLDKIMVETDAPFLAPQAFRGKRNEPSYITYLVEELAGIYGMKKADIEKVTAENAKRLFGLN
ncbi:MAG: TatD family hydrolase [Candidatus Omnitrophota bacterium]